MGEYANERINNYLSGRWGTPLPQRTYATTTRSAIAGNRFSIVEVKFGKTNRLPGTKLIVCDQNEEFYWVWAAKKVTGIAKNVCTVLQSDLSLNQALAAMGRKPYGPPPAEEDI